ncbi:type II toxin-antitoxin system VapC family toxin [Aeromicrobium fastidiosum]|uniref:type II toxin-antitoxin system VapC family toxin n=1 Tax=Aeromicrobium fastidiosum TaxID=52699 RepID=UPI001D7144B0|nr:type II toxin-antitoxin system VapC family toxin [Aeromicrobium fastidiosum]MBP2389957.1 putative nucleic acid-binding protein [Aeromicrobium fastidiosum]
MAERLAHGLLDTSVVIDLPVLDPDLLPRSVAICAITVAELAAGTLVAIDLTERARRQDRLQRVEAMFEPLPFDGQAARAYGRIFAAVAAVGRKPRSRLADLQLAAVALANDLAVVTRNDADFIGLEGLVDIVPV